MISLSIEEERYLTEAFNRSPEAWFRPTDVGQQQFSNRQIDGIVAGLVGAGMMDGQPDCHARLTPQGRKHAAHLGTPRNDWWQARLRRKVVVAA
ncbi:MAG: hypothetical protein ABIP55_06460, partial [Tepidisphaeraceae bacterium]